MMEPSNILFNDDEAFPERPCALEDPNFVHRHEFVSASCHRLSGATTTTTMVISHYMYNEQLTSGSNDRTADIKHLYAELSLTQANKERVPYKPPIGDTSVQYSTVGGHTNELTSPVQEDSSSTTQYTPIATAPPPLSVKGIVHDDDEKSSSNAYDSEDVFDYSSSLSNEKMTILVLINDTTVQTPHEDVHCEEVITSSPIAAYDNSSNTAMWCLPAASSIVSESLIEDTPVDHEIKSSTSELVIASYKVPSPLCGISPVYTSSVPEESSNYEVLPVKSGTFNVMEENGSNTTKCGQIVSTTQGIVIGGGKTMNELKREMLTNLQQKSLLVHDTISRLQVSFTGKGEIKFNMCPVSIPCLFNHYYLDTANRIIILITTTLAHKQWDIPNVVYFRSVCDKSRPVDMTFTRFGF